MHTLLMIESSPLVAAIGISLVHLVWQGFLVGAVLSLVLIAARDRAANLRYTACLSAMLLLLALPVVTLIVTVFGGPDASIVRSPHIVVLRQPDLAAGWLQPVLPWCTVVWLLGASFLHVQMLVGWLRARRLGRTGIRRLPARHQRDLDALRTRLGIDRSVRIVESALVRVPAVIGWWRPLVLLPADIIAAITPAQLRAVIAHELAHIRRHDYLVNLLQGVFESLLFFHPVTWWLSDRLRTEREYCCDDVAIEVCGSALHYARALSTLEELRNSPGRLLVASTGGNLLARISRMIDSRAGRPAGGAGWLPPLISLAGVALVAAFISAGCEIDDSGRPQLADTILGPVVPEATAETAQPSLDPERSRGLQEVTARLEACRQAGLLSDEDVQVYLRRFARLAEEDDRLGAAPIVGGSCRVIILPGGRSQGACCPDASSAVWIQPGESWADCVQRQSRLERERDETARRSEF